MICENWGTDIFSQCGPWDRHADPGARPDPDPVRRQARLDVPGRQQDRRSPQGQGQDQTQETLESGPFPSCYFPINSNNR